MQKYVNGKLMEMDALEVEAIEKDARKEALMEKLRPITEAEVSRMLIAQQVNSLAVDNNTALRMKEFYPTFDGIVGQTVSKGFKFTHNGKLWQVIQQSMTVQAHYAPGVGMESLYAEVCESHEGTEDDPIPYEGNMALHSGKFYLQDFEVYRCFRDTVNPVYHRLSDLVGLYVERM
jgi:hypothetical protein